MKPLGKTIISFFSIILGSFLAGGLINELTTCQGGVDLSNTFHSKFFYLICVYVVVLFFYYRWIYKDETAVEKFRDNEYTKAHAKKHIIPELAKEQVRLMKAGKYSEAKEAKSVLEEWMR